MNMKKHVVSAAVLCAVGIAIAGLQYGLTIRRYTVQTDKIGEGKALRLVMLSDLHSYTYGSDQSPLLHRVAAEEPDVILLCGDIVDDKKPISGAKLLLQQITNIAPCYYVSGNHEYWSEDAEAIFNLIESYGICVLHNEREEISIAGEQYMICGVDDPAANGTRIRRSYGDRTEYLNTLDSFRDLSEDRFNILLAHRPEYIGEYAEYPFDLVLCGHAHGGQWRIPYLLNGLIAPNQGFFPTYAGGQYRCGDTTAIVGRGLMLDWKPRLFNPPEIVVVDIIAAGERM